MNKKLEKFLLDKRILERNEYEEEKRKILVELDLVEKEYSPNDEYNEEYPLYEWDDVNSKGKFYKEVAIKITDEEYEEVKKYIKQSKTTKNNRVSTVLKIIAIAIYIIGFISGIVLGIVEKVETGYYYTQTYTEFSFTIAFTYWCEYFIDGTLFFGFAEIIKILNHIKNK